MMTESAPGLGFAMPTLQYNEDGWGPYEISDTFRDMPYQVRGHNSCMHTRHYMHSGPYTSRCDGIFSFIRVHFLAT